MAGRIGPKKSIRPIAERPAWAAITTIHEMAHTTHGSVLANAAWQPHICSIINSKHSRMKRLIWIFAAVGLLATGCSKDEMEDNVTDGVSSVASSANGAMARVDGNAPEIWFQMNQGRMVIQFNGPLGNLPTDCRPKGRVTFKAAGNSEDPNDVTVFEADLCRVGNSRVFRSAANQFNFGPDDHFELVDIDLEWAMADGTPGEFSGSIFLYPSGRTVTQAPELKRAKIGPIVATTDANGIATFRVVVVDDPNQEVASVEFTTKGAIDETTTPPTVTEGQTIQFEKSHVNQNLGLARWTAPYACTGVLNPETGKWECEDALLEGTLILRKAQTYDVDFIAGESSVIIGRYALSGSGSGRLTKVEDDEPVLLGTRLSSADGGATWNMEVAIADLGAWVTSVNYRFLETNGPAPLQQETPLYLVRQEGNLKVFTNKVSFDGNPKGSDYQGLIFQFGIGTRTSSAQASSKAELL